MIDLNKIYINDWIEVMKTWPDNFVQCVVTSPPYWSLRDYQVDGQLGLEKTLEEYINKLVKGFHEIKRILRPDGTLWLNMGDSYNGSGKAGKKDSPYFQKHTEFGKPAKNKDKIGAPTKVKGLKPKDLIGIPWSVAFALRDDGWWLRSDIIWAKKNPMPESVTDRPSKSHEYIFMLTKSAHYHYDQEAVRENYSDSYLNDNRHITGPTDKNMKEGYDEAGAENPKKIHKLFNKPIGSGRNLRSVWTIPTQSCSFSHFATFPEKLVNKCILAGTSPTACGVCSAPYERVLDYKTNYGKREPAHCPNNTNSKVDSSEWKPPDIKTLGFRPVCNHNDDTGKCIVLDPFCGTNTVGYCARILGHDWVGIELSEKYAEYGMSRIKPIKQNLFDAK